MKVKGGYVIPPNISFSVPQYKLLQVLEHYEGEYMIPEVSFLVNICVLLTLLSPFYTYCTLSHAYQEFLSHKYPTLKSKVQLLETHSVPCFTAYI